MNLDNSSDEFQLRIEDSSHDSSSSSDDGETGYSNSKNSIKWNLIAEYENYDQVKLYFKLLAYKTRTTQTNHFFCSFNDELIDHSFTVRYVSCSSQICNSAQTDCGARYKIISCVLCCVFKIFTSGFHVGQIKKEAEEKHGILTPIKKIIETQILDKDYAPLKIRSYLLNNKKKLETDISKNVPIPSLKQIQNFAARFRDKTGNNNLIGDVVKYVAAHLYRPDIPDDEIFFFGLNFDENDQPIINIGSDSSHLNLICSTKKFHRL